MQKMEAKELGVKWDLYNKMNYITKEMSNKNIKKLLKFEKRLYGKSTTDYEYSVKIPKKLTIEKFDEKLEIKLFVDDTRISK